MKADRNEVSARSAAMSIGAALLTGTTILGVNYYPDSAASKQILPPINVNTTGVDPQSLPKSRYLEPGELAPAITASFTAFFIFSISSSLASSSKARSPMTYVRSAEWPI